MAVNPAVERAYRRITDTLSALVPRPVPGAARLRGAKLISHRGENDNHRVLENTLPAFEQAAAAGVWGLECDIRWTSDGVPVVHHDPDLHRLFGSQAAIHQTTWRDLRARFAPIPALSEVVERFGGRMHLMLELKHSPVPAPVRRSSLQQALAPLEPVRDYHFMTLDAPREDAIPQTVPLQALVAIAYTFADPLSRWVLTRGWGGLCGHYLLLHGKIVRRHLRAGQRLGTGFVSSRNCLFRELNRGIEWIFSDNAAHLQAVVRRTLESGR